MTIITYQRAAICLTEIKIIKSLFPFLKISIKCFIASFNTQIMALLYYWIMPFSQII